MNRTTSTRPVFAGLGIALLAALAACLPAPTAHAQDAKATLPPVKIEPGDQIDLGTLNHMETGAIEIKLTNTSDKTIRFARAMGSCSCIKGTVSTDPVPPGGSATVKLTMQAIILAGLQKKELYVFADGYQRPIAFHVKAQVVDPNPIGKNLSVEPATLDLGYVKPGEAVVREILLRNNSDKPVQFARVSTTCSCVKAEILDDLTAPGEAARVKVTITPKDIGPLSQKVIVWYVGARAPLQMPVVADVTLPVKVDPFYINLATPDAGKTEAPRTGAITLTAVDKRPFRVLSAGGTAPVYDKGDTGAPAIKHVIHWDLTGAPDDQLKPWWIIETDHPGAQVLEVRVIAMALIKKMVAGQGPWTLWPDRIVAASLKPGGTYERTIRMVRAKSDKIESVTVDSPMLKAEIVDQKKTPAGVEATLRLTAAPSAHGLIRTKFTVKIDGVAQSAYLFARISG